MLFNKKMKSCILQEIFDMLCNVIWFLPTSMHILYKEYKPSWHPNWFATSADSLWANPLFDVLNQIDVRLTTTSGICSLFTTFCVWGGMWVCVCVCVCVCVWERLIYASCEEWKCLFHIHHLGYIYILAMVEKVKYLQIQCKNQGKIIRKFWCLHRQ